LSVKIEIGNVPGLCAPLFNLGHIFWQNEQPEKAMETWGFVYDISRKYNLKKGIEELSVIASELGLSEGVGYWEMRIEENSLNSYLEKILSVEEEIPNNVIQFPSRNS